MREIDSERERKKKKMVRERKITLVKGKKHAHPQDALQ
jgi:hypothetical protein